MPAYITIGKALQVIVATTIASPINLTTTTSTSPTLVSGSLMNVTLASTSGLFNGSIIVITNAGFQATFSVVTTGNPIGCYWLNAPGDSAAGSSIPIGSQVTQNSFIMGTSGNLDLVSGEAFLLSGTNCLLHCQIISVIQGNLYVAGWLGTSGDTGVGTYVLPSIQILNGGITTFTPQKFFVFQGQTWCRAIDGQFYQYGGPSNQSFDTTEAVATFTWLDLGQPEVRKTAQSIDYVARGQWNILGSMNFDGVYAASDSLKSIVTAGSIVSPTSQQASQQGQAQSWTEDGYFAQFQVSTTDSSSPGAVFSQLSFNFEVNDAK